MSAINIVTRPQDVTADWLTDALRSQGLLVDARVATVEWSPLGTGQMCDSARLRLRYDGDADLDDTMVAKFPSASEGSRLSAAATRSYEKEVRFYQELAPSLDINTPCAYFSAISPHDTTEFVLLLEDRSPAAQGDQLAGCSPDVAQRCVGEIAGLHAARWNDGALADFGWLAGPTPDEISLLATVLPMLWTQFLDRYDGAIEPSLRRAGSVFFDHVANYFEAERTASGITHADYRLDNLLFGPGQLDGTAPPHPTVVDWQTVSVAAPPSDVAYFLGSSLSVNDRRNHEFEILAQYLSALAERGVTYSASDLEYEYRRGIWSGFAIGVGAAVLVERTERGDEMFLTMLHRHAQHALDLDADETIR